MESELTLEQEQAFEEAFRSTGKAAWEAVPYTDSDSNEPPIKVRCRTIYQAAIEHERERQSQEFEKAREEAYEIGREYERKRLMGIEQKNLKDAIRREQDRILGALNLNWSANESNDGSYRNGMQDAIEIVKGWAE